MPQLFPSFPCSWPTPNLPHVQVIASIVPISSGLVANPIGTRIIRIFLGKKDTAAPHTVSLETVRLIHWRPRMSHLFADKAFTVSHSWLKMTQSYPPPSRFRPARTRRTEKHRPGIIFCLSSPHVPRKYHGFVSSLSLRQKGMSANDPQGTLPQRFES